MSRNIKDDPMENQLRTNGEYMFPLICSEQSPSENVNKTKKTKRKIAAK